MLDHLAGLLLTCSTTRATFTTALGGVMHRIEGLRGQGMVWLVTASMLIKP